jgi:predicted nuclease of predicted toxin-antitoxin system
MLPLAVDADVNHAIVRGLRRQAPEIDLVLSQDVLPEGTPDPDVLAWAAAENRLLITNDRGTMIGFAKRRVASGEPMPGLVVATKEQAIGAAIEHIFMIADCMTEDGASKRDGSNTVRHES